jgi:hypothetical protein
MDQDQADPTFGTLSLAAPQISAAARSTSRRATA